MLGFKDGQWPKFAGHQYQRLLPKIKMSLRLLALEKNKQRRKTVSVLRFLNIVVLDFT